MQSTRVLHFYANQTEIAKKHCVNKDKPALNCHGKCHLNKQLNAVKPDPESSNQNQISTSILVFQFFEEIENIKLPDQDFLQNCTYLYSDLYSLGHPHSIFHPPC